MNNVIKNQLEKVIVADLSNYNPETNTYIIPKRKDKKIEEDKCYLIHLKAKAFSNRFVIDNWNSGSMPSANYLKADISKKMNKMIKVVSVGYDFENQRDLATFWSGWLSVDDIEVISELL